MTFLAKKMFRQQIFSSFQKHFQKFYLLPKTIIISVT